MFPFLPPPSPPAPLPVAERPARHMNFRDYIAVQVMAALLTSDAAADAGVTNSDESIARESYSLADAMLKARVKELNK